MIWKEILYWLHEEDPQKLESLWLRADQLRRDRVGDQVHLRGIVEFSNHCERSCLYCGLRAPNLAVKRYIMSAGEIVDCARQAEDQGCGTVVLQSGEDKAVFCEWIAALSHRIKSETRLAVALSLGERNERELSVWRQAGADRYLLRFESSNRDLYQRLHPAWPERSSDRVALLTMLRRMRYEIGTGMMVGLPGQTYFDLAKDIELLGELDPDMIGIGPYIPHPETPLGKGKNGPFRPVEKQVPNSVIMTCKALALARILCPGANIPSTTALETMSPGRGLELGLARGANIVMPNLTPMRFRTEYQIYPGRVSPLLEAESGRSSLAGRLQLLGRSMGSGRGDSLRKDSNSHRAPQADL